MMLQMKLKIKFWKIGLHNFKPKKYNVWQFSLHMYLSNILETYSVS